MMRGWWARHGGGVAVGLALTGAAVVLHAGGFTERLELLGFDLLVEWFSRVPASDKILHIDIDDDALERVGSWPWPRDLQAGLVRALHELGARQVVMDIVFSEPRPPEVRLPSLERFADIEGEIEELGEASAENVVFGDDELADAISTAGNVCLSYFYEQRVAGATTELEQTLSGLLIADFNLDVAALARKCGESMERVQGVLAGVKRRVARERVHAILTTRPAAGLREVHQSLLNTPFDRFTADRQDIVAAYHRELSLRALAAASPKVPEQLKGRLPRVGEVVPPVYQFTAGAWRCGFVTFAPDSDGRTRHVPLLAEWNGRLVEQLSFAAAREALGIELEDLSLDDRGALRITARGERPAMRVPLDEQGRVLINWHVASGGWQECFRHLPVAQLLRLHDADRQLKDNRIRRALLIGKAMRLVKDDAGFEQYRSQVNERIRLERQIRWATLQGRGQAPEIERLKRDSARLKALVESDEKESLALIAEEWAGLGAESQPDDPAIAGEYRRFKEAHELAGDRVAELDLENQRIVSERDRLIAELRPLVQDNICFVGYTATAVADMVNTPAYERMPGVLVHSQVLNSLLQGRFLNWSGLGIRLGVIVVLGAVVTLVTVQRGPTASLVFVVSLILVSLGVNAFGLFAWADYWLRLVTGLVLVFCAWALVVMFRLLVTDRQKRRFSKALAQYVSPAMARQISESAVPIDFSPREAQVSCFFSDLAGFTRISEELGPEGTRAVLNPYLEAMSDALHRQGGLINKFMGDGVFAFFNAPILPCEHHAMAACESALNCRRALDELKQRYAEHPMAREFNRLAMRIGITTGHAFVGDYGSEAKLDYTCMGDTVNLAARLESANKQFGTGVLIAGRTRDLVGDKYCFRLVGRIQVKGQSVGVPVHELLGRPGETKAESLAFAHTFEAAVNAFVAGDWSAARRGFESCLGLRAGDRGVLRYLELISAYESHPPPEDWSGVIELTEK